MIRPARLHDLDAILRLNAQWEHVTSPLTEGSLAHLHANASYHRVLELDARVVAFLLALGPGVGYESLNYRWFDARPGEFLYIDRVVVAEGHQRSGFGDALYDDVLSFARQRDIPRLVCEVDVEPHNTASDSFHERRGFVEVGTQWVAGGTKRVSLRECLVTHAPAHSPQRVRQSRPKGDA